LLHAPLPLMDFTSTPPLLPPQSLLAQLDAKFAHLPPQQLVLLPKMDSLFMPQME
jgi:hypothetical protein